MAFSEGLQAISGEAAADLTGKQYRFVVVVPGSSDNLKEQYNVSGDAGEIHGVSMNAPAAQGRALTVAKRGRCPLEAGGTVNVGDLISSDSVGRGVAAVSGEIVGGRAVTGAAVGEYFTIELQLEGGRL
jgi:hypothetical protein